MCFCFKLSTANSPTGLYGARARRCLVMTGHTNAVGYQRGHVPVTPHPPSMTVNCAKGPAVKSNPASFVITRSDLTKNLLRSIVVTNGKVFEYGIRIINK